MALIKTDPSQTKTVVVLLAVLVVAIAFIAIRLSPPAPVAPESEEQPTAASTSASKVGKWSVELARNPFEQPPFPADAAEGKNEAAAMARVGPAPRGLTEGGPVPVNPFAKMSGRLPGAMAAQGAPGMELAPAPAHSLPKGPAGAPETPDQPSEPKPVFTLLATIGDARGLSAVIQCQNAKPRVVETGDVLDGGYRISRIERDRAVLTDGRDTIVAKRPRP